MYKKINYLPVESIMIPVAVPCELLGDTLCSVILRRRPNVSFPSNSLSKNTGTVTELLLLPGGNVADSRAELKSTLSMQCHHSNLCLTICLHYL